MAFRLDNGSLRPPRRLADGRLRADGYLTRTGVFTYLNPDGSQRREYRPEAEVFRADSLTTFADAIVTDDHPATLVTADNAKQVQVGHVSGQPRRDGDYVAATLVVSDAETIRKIESGKVQLSCGYECDLDPTPGVAPTGERYDAVQTNIRGNHVAIVEMARAGEAARIRMDAAMMVAEQETPMNALEQALAAMADHKARADKAEADLATARAQVQNLERDLAAERQLRTDAVAAEPARIRARVELEREAAPVLGDAFKPELTDREIKTAVVKRVDGEDLAADLHEAAVEVLYRGALKRHAAAAQSLAEVRQATEVGRNDSANTAAKARAAMVERLGKLSQINPVKE